MRTAALFAFGSLIVALLFVVAAWVWYNYTGWTAFSAVGAVPTPSPPPSLCSAPEACVAGSCASACTTDADCGASGGTCTAGRCPPTQVGGAAKACCAPPAIYAGGGCRTPCSAGCPANQICGTAGVCLPDSTPSWHPTTGGDVSRLRFKACVFTVVDPSGTPHTADVTAVLNGMAAAHAGSKSPPAALTLDRPLNAFSFLVPGVNDPASAADPGLWANSKTTLGGFSRTI